MFYLHFAQQIIVVVPEIIIMQKRLEVAQVTLHQRSLPTTQAHFPTAGDTARFCLLCCQPEPMPMSLSTRTSQFPLWSPCRVPSQLGQAINTVNRT